MFEIKKKDPTNKMSASIKLANILYYCVFFKLYLYKSDMTLFIYKKFFNYFNKIMQ